jgi:hypothetical protein
MNSSLSKDLDNFVFLHLVSHYTRVIYNMEMENTLSRDLVSIPFSFLVFCILGVLQNIENSTSKDLENFNFLNLVTHITIVLLNVEKSTRRDLKT